MKIPALIASSAFLISAAVAQVSHSVKLDNNWRLWLDREAQWKNDELFLPSDVHLSKMPANPPTGGWSTLDDQKGISVSLPTTVEEHYWGGQDLRPYSHFEAQRGKDTSFPNGNYLGVSWWWRKAEAPKFKPGQHVVLYVRGARLRAEVYCNGKLCGYSLIGELPFEADLTNAVEPGKPATIALRITNPGGHLDWIDFGSSRLNWGKYTLPPSHGFGGLDEGITLAVRDQANVSDIAAINTPDLHKVRLRTEVTALDKPFNGAVDLSITRNGSTVWSGKTNVTLPAGASQEVETEALVSSAEPWELKNPRLYEAHARLAGQDASDRSVSFGFRYMTAKGIGSNDAKLVMNDKRIVLMSAISWGFWGRNGLWPDKEMAAREVSDAKTIGLNCLQFHRNLGKPEVLDLQDKEGLLRCEEPGAGKFVIGPRYAKGPFGPNGEFLTKEGGNDCLDAPRDYSEPTTVDTSGSGPEGDGKAFWERYEEAKILGMVKRDRSHPSLILYNIQNESNSIDLRNPRIYRVLREMHKLDPSRIITFFSGGDPRIDQVLMLPDQDEIRYGSKAEAYAGWRDVHTCGGPCNYLDNLYTDPNNFTQHQSVQDRKDICVWGETLGAATPDDYDKLVHSFDPKHPSGYELDDDRNVLNAYHEFLDKRGFRKAFPTDSALFQAIGFRTYYFWQKILEQSRFDNATDGVVVSGWESTSIDNHSGLVDNHRFFKGDPKVIAAATKPELLVIKPRHMIVAKGDKDLIDVFLINETGRQGSHHLNLEAKRPDGSVSFHTEKEVQVQGGDTYGQPLAVALEVPADAAGMLNLSATLTPTQGDFPKLERTEQVEVVGVQSPILAQVAVLEPGHEVSETLQNVFHTTASKLEDTPDSTHLDAIILAPKTDRDAKSRISDQIMDKALARVKEGTRLILWPDDNFRANDFINALAQRGIVTSKGDAGNLNAPWFGSWFFVRKHWLLDGLPSDCAMDWRYGVSAFGGPAWLQDEPRGSVTNGFMIDAPGMETVVGFGADHSTKIGVSGCVIPYGKGQIVFYCLPQLVRSLAPGNFAISQPICQKLLGNALRVEK